MSGMAVSTGRGRSNQRRVGKGSRAGGQFLPTQRADIPASSSSMSLDATGDGPGDRLTDTEQAAFRRWVVRVMYNDNCPPGEALLARTAEHVGDHAALGFVASCWGIRTTDQHSPYLVDAPSGEAAADQIRAVIKDQKLETVDIIQLAVMERSVDGLVNAASGGTLSQDMAEDVIHQASHKFVCENDHTREISETI